MAELPHSAGEVISYIEMCSAWSTSLQRGMNFHLQPSLSVVLMSRRANAPYADRIEEGGRVLIYEGHDVSRTKNGPNPKEIDQPSLTPSGKLTQNGLFEIAAHKVKDEDGLPEVVAVYEKIHAGIWAFNGFFHLTDSWQERDSRRAVFKFRLELSENFGGLDSAGKNLSEPTRLIPSSVKLEVWKRDRAQCVLCGSRDHLHFDHDLPFSKGGNSLTAKNIRLLCARHNLAKSDRIE